MKILKYISLVWLIISIASAVSNWGGEMTKNPISVCIMLFVSVVCYVVGDFLDDERR